MSSGNQCVLVSLNRYVRYTCSNKISTCPSNWTEFDALSAAGDKSNGMKCFCEQKSAIVKPLKSPELAKRSTKGLIYILQLVGLR